MVIDRRDLKFNKSDDKALEQLLKLDFRTKEGEDSLGINAFMKDIDEVKRLIKNKFFTVHVVGLRKQAIRNEIIGFFALSMGAITIDESIMVNKQSNTELISYPALVINYIGIHQEYQKHKVGSHIVDYVEGLAIEIDKKISCAAVTAVVDKVSKDFFISKSYEPLDEVYLEEGMILYRVVKKMY